MASNNNNNKDRERDLEIMFDQNDEDANEGEQQDIEAVKFESESSSSESGSDDDDDEGRNHRAQPESFSTQQWPQSYKETTDSYTIAAAPNFKSFIQGPSFLYSSFVNRSKSNLEIDGKIPFLSGQEGSITQSTWWEKASIERHITGELPIGYGCSFTQTVFNGINVMAGVGLLSTPYTVNQAGWASMLVMHFFFLAVVCCYTATLLKAEKESLPTQIQVKLHLEDIVVLLYHHIVWNPSSWKEITALAQACFL